MISSGTILLLLLVRISDGQPCGVRHLQGRRRDGCRDEDGGIAKRLAGQELCRYGRVRYVVLGLLLQESRAGGQPNHPTKLAPRDAGQIGQVVQGQAHSLGNARQHLESNEQFDAREHLNLQRLALMAPELWTLGIWQHCRR